LEAGLVESDIGRTAIQALSENVLNTQFEDIDEQTVESAKNRIIDIVGCAIGGSVAGGNKELVDLVRGWGGKEEATLLVFGGKVPAHYAAMVNSIICRSFDFEAMTGVVAGKKIGSHISGSTVPTALALGEATGASGKELITALLVGDDVANRVLLGFDFDFFHGWDGIGTLAIFGTTAIAGRLLGLNSEQMRNAFGLALNLTAGAIQSIWDGATAFKLPQGAAAMNGIFSSTLARAGWTGVDDALLSRFGYYTLYTHGCTHPEMLTKDLGRIYYAENGFKPYPSCGATHMTIDCALALVSRYKLDASDIEEVTISGPRPTINNFVGKPFQIRNFPHCDAIFSLQYTCATALLRKGVKPEHFTEDSIRDPRVNALINKIKIAELPEERGKGFEVKVRMKNGKEYSEYTNVARGNVISKPLTKEEIVAKYMSQVEFSRTINQTDAEKLLESLERLEELNNINRIVKLAVKRSN
jgi:2-methylcitrate dehydratase PrpD